MSIDGTAPALSLTPLLGGDTVFTPAIALGGSATDTGSGLKSVTCNSAPATVVGTHFSCDLTLAIGSTLI